MKVLVVEDETGLRESIAAYLQAQEYTCHAAANFSSACDLLDDNDYDCLILDITLPGGSGLQLLRMMKEQSKLDGVLIISAKNSVDDKINGLNLGADDYLAKPFDLSELNARVGAIIRRKNFDGNQSVSFDKLEIDTLQKSVTTGGTEIILTRKEYDLLTYFISNRRRVISKEAIARHLWGEALGGNYDFIYTHIKNLRKKLLESCGVDYIKSVYGLGYKFSAE